MSKRTPSTEPCIYCGSTTPRQSREHVIPRALGTFENNWTLTCVCHGCNQYFCRELEFGLAYDSAEAFLRLAERVRPPADAAKLGKQRMKAWLREPGPFDGVRVEFKATNDGVQMKPTAVPQVSFRRDGEGEWTTVTEPELTSETVPKLPGIYEFRVASPREAMPKLRKKLADLGIKITVVEEYFEQPISRNLSIPIEHEFFVDVAIARMMGKIVFNYAAKVLGGVAMMQSSFDRMRRFIRFGEGDMSLVQPRREPLIKPLQGQKLRGHGCGIGWAPLQRRLNGIVAPFNEISYGFGLSVVDSFDWQDVNRCHFFDLDSRAILEVPDV